MPPTNGHIDKLDFPPPDERRPLLNGHGERAEPSPGRSQNTSCSGSFFEQVAEGIQERDRAKFQREVTRYGSFLCAILNWYCCFTVLTDDLQAVLTPCPKPLLRFHHRLLALRSFVHVSPPLQSGRGQHHFHYGRNRHVFARSFLRLPVR